MHFHHSTAQKMHQQRTAWNDFLPDSPTTNFFSQTYKSKQSPSGTGVYVFDCLFISCSSTGDGGALYCTSTYILIESSSFFSCRTSNTWGGAVRLGGSHCVLYKVCGNDCCSTNSGSNGQFAFALMKDEALSKCYVNYSSISRCVNEISNSCQMLYHDYGKFYCPSVNISMNKCQYYSGIYCYPFSDSSSATCSLSYSSFADNNAFGYTFVLFNNGGAKYEIKCCNILRNTQGTTSYGTIYANGILMIDDSCILENTASIIFYSSSSSYTITLTNCHCG
jgi:predicted outer membrane repeat protein